jgi:hypothetical protein
LGGEEEELAQTHGMQEETTYLCIVMYVGILAVVL